MFSDFQIPRRSSHDFVCLIVPIRDAPIWNFLADTILKIQIQMITDTNKHTTRPHSAAAVLTQGSSYIFFEHFIFYSFFLVIICKSVVR